jgi:glycosyltransferase involved in cell wall biosynthesis
MKVLWIVNSLFPEAVKLLKHTNTEIQGSGGWLPSLANMVACSGEVELYVASFSSLVSQTQLLIGENYSFYVLPYFNLRRYNKRYEPLWKELYKECNPDIVHIHGTEFSHGLTYVNACGNYHTVVSIQGMPTVICDYWYSGVEEKEIRRTFTLKSLLQGNLIREKKEKEKTIKKYEIDLLNKVKYVIGRTSWDKAHTWAINPNLTYYHCNETLREPFYDGCWSYEKCVPHTIFLSQAGRALKGTHQLLKAMPLIQRHYPDVKIRIAGDNIIDATSWRKRLLMTGYGKILYNMIQKNGLQNAITFTGPLNAEEMKAEYLRSNVFVSPSSIENSPNSLCEAQVLGVPCVASYVGGTMDFIPNSNCGILYRFDDIEMLAKAVCDTFENSPAYDNTEMRERTLQRHDKSSIVRKQLEIYHKILE